MYFVDKRMGAKSMSSQMDWYLHEVERYEQLGFLRKKTLMEELEIIAEQFPHNIAVVFVKLKLSH